MARPVIGVTDAYGIDYTRPVFAQITALGDRYWTWSHEHLTPAMRGRIAAARPDARWPDSFPIFTHPWLERQTHIRWQHVLLLWGIVATTCAVAGGRLDESDPAAATAWWLAGFVLWTLVEYGLHRVVFHARARTPLQIRFHFLAHGIHHKDPWDRTRLVFPLLGGIGIAAVLLLLANLLLPPAPALLLMSGLLVGYLAYDLGHFAWHHASLRAGWFRYLKRYHLAHHFQDMDSRYGVSQPFWDWVFRSGPSRG